MREEEKNGLVKQIRLLREKCKQKDKEIDRLNTEIDYLNSLREDDRKELQQKDNIINELEKWCNNGIKNGIHIAYEQELDYEDVLDKLKELKEDNNAKD